MEIEPESDKTVALYYKGREPLEVGHASQVEGSPPRSIVLPSIRGAEVRAQRNRSSCSVGGV